jgi:hypothetical protein
MAKTVVRQLDDEYELGQLNPVYSGRDPEVAQIEKEISTTSEGAAMRMRTAVLEAVVDDLIETKIEQAEQVKEAAAETGDVAPPSPAEVEEAVAPVVDTAVALKLVPASLKARVRPMIAAHLRKHNPYYTLLSKAAKFVANELVDIKEEDTVIEEQKVIDMTPADEGVDINNDSVEAAGNTKQDKKAAVPFIEAPTSRANWMKFFMEDTAIGESELDTKPADIGVDPINATIEAQKSTDTTDSDAPVTAAPQQRYSRYMRVSMDDTAVGNDTIALDNVDNSSADIDDADKITTTDSDAPVTAEVMRARLRRGSRMSAADGNDAIGTSELDNKPEKESVDINDEVLVPEGDSAQTDGSIPAHQADALKYLACSCVNERKATMLVSRKLTGVLLSQTLYQLRNCLPDWYKTKYGLR